ncbi:hypothetical protein J2X01_004348 [Arthrobacter ginsengisoli]|uniref:Uncharacterized protein n=1 Tax=Arthrobacter ginsengisoli TaxID=1356565 RepID=A0ABU1UIP3_9MICC|nr:hypothetical protein [Arthrobacter ginsengisoli]MDR7085028.1 hypothetical protein [Arthrobacter ginsengisoli]
MRRGIAYREQGGASRDRPPELLQRVLMGRAFSYSKEGDRVMGRRDFGTVKAENSNYPGLREFLAWYQV